MGVGDEDVVGSKETGWAQCMVVAEVEQEGALGPADLDEEAGIAEHVIDQVA